MIPRQTRLRVLAAVTALSFVAGPAFAQYTGYDANCDPRNYTADEQMQQELCMAHIGCRMTTKAANSACKVKDFLSNLGGLLGGRSTPDNVDVLEAMNRTEVPQTAGVKQLNAASKPYYQGSRVPSYDRSNSAQVDWQQAFYGPPQTTGPRGTLTTGRTWFEGVAAPDGAGRMSGSGVGINTKGDIKAGPITNNNLDGDGIRRAADGSWAGGKFNGGGLNGNGYTYVPEPSGTAPVMEGTYVNGQPDGMMLVTWPDFSSRKEYWKNGQMISAGPKVPKGSIPLDPKTPEQEAAEKAAAAEAKFASELNAITSADGLYALGDEWAEKGDMEKARKAWRELIRRFPDNSLVPNAADRLSANGASKAAPSGTGSKASGTSGQPGDLESCDSSSYFSESMANEDYWLEKTMNAGNGAYGGSRDIYKFMYLKNRAGLAILEKHKACNEPNVYAEQKKYMEDTMNVALQNCMALSSDGGRGCTQE